MQLCFLQLFFSSIFFGLSLFDPWLPQVTPAWPLTPAMHYALVKGSSYQIWWPWIIPKQFDLWLTPADPCMTFDATNALHPGQGFFLPNLVAIGHSWAIWPLVDPALPLRDPRPQQCITLLSRVFPTKFGSHRAFLRQIDLWMTFDLWSGRFEKLTTNLGGPCPTPMPSFSSIRQSTTKCIAGHTKTRGNKSKQWTHFSILKYFSVYTDVLFSFISFFPPPIFSSCIYTDQKDAPKID